jgi:group I intron endonuclease
MENKGEVYLVTNTVNGKRYVGQTVCYVKEKSGRILKRGSEHRWKTHVWSAMSGENRCTAMCAAIRKYGQHNFTVKTIIICDISQLTYYESKFARFYNSYAPNGYNIRQPSSKGRLSEETKKKISLAKSKENNHMWGKKHKDETINKMRNTKKNKVKKPIEPELVEQYNIWKSNLPDYVYFRREITQNRIGYTVRNHPTKPPKHFMYKNMTMEGKRQAAIQYVNESSSENK